MPQTPPILPWDPLCLVDELTLEDLSQLIQTVEENLGSVQQALNPASCPAPVLPSISDYKKKEDAQQAIVSIPPVPATGSVNDPKKKEDVPQAIAPVTPGLSPNEELIKCYTEDLFACIQAKYVPRLETLLKSPPPSFDWQVRQNGGSLMQTILQSSITAKVQEMVYQLVRYHPLSVLYYDEAKADEAPLWITTQKVMGRKVTTISKRPPACVTTLIEILKAHIGIVSNPTYPEKFRSLSKRMLIEYQRKAEEKPILARCYEHAVEILHEINRLAALHPSLIQAFPPPPADFHFTTTTTNSQEQAPLLASTISSETHLPNTTPNTTPSLPSYSSSPAVTLNAQE